MNPGTPDPGADRGSRYGKLFRQAVAESVRDFWKENRHKIETGFWLVQLKRRGPWCPAAIMLIHTAYEPGNPTNLMERSPFLAAFVSGEPVDLEDVMSRRVHSITEDVYWRSCQEIDRARSLNVYDPRAHPRRAIKLAAMPLPGRGKSK